MSLKQIKPIDRITFLRRFAAELIIHSKKSEVPKKIQIEKLKQKFLQPIETPGKAFEKPIKPSIFQRPIYAKREPILYRLPISKRPIQIQKQTLQKPALQKLIPAQVVEKIEPEPQARPEGFALGKLEPLLKDTSIQSIECPGPGKNLLIKRYNKINVTKTILNQAEISSIINDFSEKARIPIVGGILKAAVGDLVISAVISEFVGSRFIINKITAYSLIDG